MLHVIVQPNLLDVHMPRPCMQASLMHIFFVGVAYQIRKFHICVCSILLKSNSIGRCRLQDANMSRQKCMQVLDNYACRWPKSADQCE